MEKFSLSGNRGYDSNRSVLNPRPIKLNIIKKYIQFYNSFLVFTLIKKIFETNNSYVFVMSNNLVFHILCLGMSRLYALM